MDGGGNSRITGVKLSSVFPATPTGENKVKELTATDLAMKLHYIRGVYFFRPSEELRNLTISDLKRPMYPLLDLYYVVSGRIRRRIDGGDRPYIKCNDSGVRIVEAECEKTIEDWLSIGDDDQTINSHRDGDLVHCGVIGPDLEFSPLVFIQLTRFKCGGLSVGLTWAHVLGDIFSASAFINTWGHIMKNRPVDQLQPPATSLIQPSKSTGPSTSPLKRQNPIGDLWIGSSGCKMATRSFRITEEQLDRISTVVSRNRPAEFSNFEAIAAIFWKSLSIIRFEYSDSKTISIYSTKFSNREGEIPMNRLVMSVVVAGFPVARAEDGAVAELIMKKKIDESGDIEELVEKEIEKSDFIAYGARLTIVDLEGANLYGLDLLGQKPIYVNYEIGGVGENGVVLVLPGPPRGDGRDGGRTVTVILPEKELPELVYELQKQWAIV